MIVERMTEDSQGLLDNEMMSSPMNLAYFYAGSPISDSGSSPAYSTSSVPGSPSSDYEPAGSLITGCKKVGTGRQPKGTFQGVRVKNSVRELLNKRRSKSVLQGDDEFQNQNAGINFDQYTELKNILRSKKRSHDFTSEGTAAKKACNFPSTLLLTPPGTPQSNEVMDSDLDLLQSIMNIKNELKPVSLNTVQVNWDNLPQNDNAQDQHFQDIAMAPNVSSTQSAQVFYNCTSPQKSEQYPFGSLQVPDVLQYPNTEYNHFVETSPVHTYQEAFLSNEFLNCAMENYVPYSTFPDTPPEIVPAKQATELGMTAQTFIPTLNTSFSAPQDHSVAHASQTMTPELCLQDRNNSSPLQMGKSFFHWQIEQEERKLANVSQEQLLIQDSDGDTYLHISVAHGRRALSYVLAQKMAALNMLDIKEFNKQSPLQVAVVANQHLIVQDLISLGAQVNTTDRWGRTPLHLCAINAYPQVLQAIQKGLTGSNQYLEIDATDYNGLTALHCAVIAHNAVVQQIHSDSDKLSPGNHELFMKNKACVDTIKTLLQMGASVEAKDLKSGRTALHLATEEANLELLSIFLELPNCLSFINTKAFNGNTALHVAASLQYKKMHVGAVRLLMRKGADPSARNLENEQPVHLVPDSPEGEEIRRVLKGRSMQHRSSSY
ncbi:NF-kappa-B inhibitor zeta [Spea bombifrons]|uniref:NF-kappa-B inhibitor zeta n=1 Tax=Spea bombifrons TaxID=233779 RepID=UPI0023490C5D|nr:NF-kappa-B inhibitor zeta [Spea bombifrons]